ncbi:Nucleolar protein of 40 kDa [Podila verticillata]|nr:Nucleolar protein of 40 kDa [Podila verticillata]
MDSQLAAFEKFKSSGGGSGGREHRHGHGNSRESRGHGARDDHSGPVPDLYSIHRGKVVRVEDYGAFVQMQGFHKHGLVHKSQASRHFTEKISDVVEVGDSVWVKVTSLQDNKISLSMKHVQQGSGEDLDPNLVQQTGEEDKRRSHAGFVDKAPIAIEQGGVLLKTVCKKCGAAGHLATECFSGGEKFELLGDEDDGEVDMSHGSLSRDKDKKKKKEKKESRDRDRDRERDRDRDRKDRDRDGDRSRHDKRDRDHYSSSHRKEKRERSRRSDSSRSKVESVEDALAVMRARKVSEEHLAVVFSMGYIDSGCKYDDSVF